MRDYMRPNSGVRVNRDETKRDTVHNIMFDMANNVSVLRSMRGNCRMVNGNCQEHGKKMRRVSQTKIVWTRNNKTGLFSYKKRKVSAVRCDGYMETLVGTMGMLDGAGGNNESAGASGDVE